MPPTKRARTKAEIASLATRLGADWSHGDSVMLWLRRHVDELTELVRNEGWSWGAIGQALDAAGIRYSTGRPWSAPILTGKAKLARDTNARLAAEKARRDAATQIAPVAELLKAALGELAQPPQPATRKKGKAPGRPTQPPEESPPSEDDDDGIVITPAGGTRRWKSGEK